jgi:hypothetical protein
MEYCEWDSWGLYYKTFTAVMFAFGTVDDGNEVNAKNILPH